MDDRQTATEAQILSILSLLGGMDQRLRSMEYELHQLTTKTDFALLSPEEKETKIKKAKEIIDKMKKEAELEIEAELMRRHRRGIGNDGDALTEEERRAWESGDELPQ